jgi:hypothetical protein
MWSLRFAVVSAACAGSVAQPGTGRGVIVCRDSGRRGRARESSLHARRPQRHGGYDGDLDECRFGFPYIDVGCGRMELGCRRTGRTVFICLPECGDVSVPLHDSPWNGGDGGRALMR